MISLKQATGRQVVSRASAEKLGELRNVVVDPATRTVVAVQVGKGRKARIVDWTSLSGLGEAAVVVDTEASLREPHDGREHALVHGDVTLLGALVLSDAGDAQGSLEDVDLDETTGALLVLRTSAGLVDAGRLLGIGSYAVVVSAGG